VKIDCDYVLTDIEGTTTSISFVQDVLFPYFLLHINEIYLLSDMNEVKYIFGKVIRIVKKEENKNITTSEEVIEQLKIWCKEDRKIKQLKTLQGILWEKGYQSGELFGHIYDDVPPILNQWHSLGKKMGIFSSGSSKAQKLLYKYSDKGDLSNFFSHYFDTNIGAKRDTETYSSIAQEIKLPAKRILFLSDVIEELDAAENAGFQALQIKREGNEQSWNKSVSDFSQIILS
jgi:enolase-phosphatase E1